jgi:predicted metal-dependent phosphoesterase TrpH
MKAEVELLFLTDHDSVSGFSEALEAAGRGGLSVHCGIEINTCQADRVHILGYGLRWQDEALARRLEEYRARRFIRVGHIIENLNRHGIAISLEDVRGVSQETLGRPHVADALKRLGIVCSRQEAFERFLIRGKPGYAEPMGPGPQEAIALIREQGGFASLAHPQTVKDFTELESWVSQGLEGMEVYYGSHSPSEIKRYGDIAQHHGLIATGGSDYHGPGSGREVQLGVDVPDEIYERFMERLSRCG